MKITLAQLNPKIGDFNNNFLSIQHAIEKATLDKSDLIVFSELIVTGYPPKDLLLYPHFREQVETTIQDILTLSNNFPELGIVLGTPVWEGQHIYNSALLIQKGQTLFRQDKTYLPSYDVFDEHRYFTPASDQKVIKFKEETLGILICEDFWLKEPVALTHKMVNQGASILINLSASPFESRKFNKRLKIHSDLAKALKTPVILVNQVGGNDSVLFDGRSFALNRKGDCCALASSFEQDVMTVDLHSLHSIPLSEPQEEIDMYKALVMGVKDYVHKSGFKNVVLGLSGGIDSALTATLAVDALGAEHVRGLTLPSQYSSKGSVEDSVQLAKNLGIKCDQVAIEDMFTQSMASLNPLFKEYSEDVTEENLQARIRGLFLMAVSNKTGALLLTTGNKSEMAVGYCTLYGDMNGGLAVISDVPKTMVYKLADYINRDTIRIPENTIKKSPSAELRPGQLDQDSLPDYDTLDAILKAFIEDHLSKDDIIKLGYDTEIVSDILKKVQMNEYKRYQAAPGLKVTSKAFGVGRRIPLCMQVI